jgi:hypothetical protein
MEVEVEVIMDNDEDSLPFHLLPRMFQAGDDDD